MPLPDFSSVDNSTHEIYSGGWRTQEARNIFTLLRHEYNNSKRLNVVKRYKELERIINMFTSEPVLMKLFWFTSEDVDASSLSYDSEIDLEGDKDDSESSKECESPGWQAQSQTFKDKGMNGFRNISARIKSITSLVSVLRHINPTNTADFEVQAETQSANHSSCMGRHSSVGFLSSSSPFASSVSTPNGLPKSPSSPSFTNSTFVFNTGALVDVNTSSCQAALRTGSCSNCNSSPNSDNSSNPQNSSSMDVEAPSAKEPPSHRRGIETCIIRRNEIPPFQIPPQRTIRDELPKLDPSSYIDKTFAPKARNTLHGCKGNSKPFLKISASTPDIIDRNLTTLGMRVRGFVSGNNQQERCCSDNSILSPNVRRKPLFKDIDDLTASETHSKSSKKNSCTNSYYQKDCLSAYNLSRAYDNLKRMKTEFHQLNNKNVFVKYRKMKSVIKSCMDIQV